MPPKRTLESGRNRLNPYANTVQEAMNRLGSMQKAIEAMTEENLRISAREQTEQRKLIRHGYAAGSDSVGWHLQNRSGHDWRLRRITVLTNAQLAGPLGLFIGSQGPAGLREVIPTTQLTALTFSTGETYSGYSDAFDNDIYVRSGEDIYLYACAAGGVTANTILAALEVIEYVPYRDLVTEDETFAMTGTPEPNQPERAPSGTIDPDEFQRHEQTADIEAYETDSEDVAPKGKSEGGLIPDAALHLPEHLRALA